MRNVAFFCIGLLVSAIVAAGMPLPFMTSLSLRYDLKAKELLTSEQKRLSEFLEAMASRGQCEVMVEVTSDESTSGPAVSVRDLLRRNGIANVRLLSQVTQPVGEVQLIFRGNHGPPGCTVH